MRVQVHYRSLPGGLGYFCDDAEQRGIARTEPSFIDESPCWINEAAFDAFDEALLEGEDPIEFNGSPLADLRT
ncbi:MULTISPECIES: hypothetical protein [unclassified Paraburkholderia]|uniref:hypothetical protein n=1 Tax=unclassified Paraburkholderia TaxID=2615204 RepID=UPI002AB1C3B5|nr:MULTISPECIES: hypothetical protein [unclassified Paraburkholderia]